MEPTAPTVPGSSAHIDAKLAAIGAVSGIVAAMMMDTFSRLMQASDARGAPPARAAGPAEDPTVKVGTAAFRSVAGYTPGRETRQWLGTAAHLAFNAAVGMNYLLASERSPELRRGFGTVYGSLVWATADEGAAPALGLSRTPDAIPLGAHASALGAHLVYGATLEGCRRIAAALLDAWERSGTVVDGIAEPVPATSVTGAAGTA
jgi:uncharacterized membrane protein YagU involved in acid resistance